MRARAVAEKGVELKITADGRAAQAALGRLAADLERAAGNANGELKPALQRAAAELRTIEAEAGKADAQLGRMAGTGEKITEVLRGAAVGFATAFSARELVQAAADMEKMQVGLQAVTGSAAQARTEMEFVRRVATQAGVDAVAAGEAYLGLAAAVKGTAVEGQPTRDVFEAVSVSMAKAGKSSGETRNALMALQQMAGKGVVSMEEMRQQLGEALPGAFQATAKGLDITTQDLIKLIESGQLAAEDLFPALTKGLNDLYGGAPAAQTLSQEIINIKNAFVEMAANIGEAGGLDALKRGAELAQTAIVLLDDALVTTGKTLGVLMGAVTTLDFSGVKQAFADIEAESRDKLLKAAQHNETLRGYIGAVGNEALQSALAVQQAATATTAAAAQAGAAAPSYAALATAYAAVKKEVAEQIELATKEVAATKARGEAAVAEAKLKGDEAALRKAIGQAAANEAAALQELAAKRQTEVDVLRAELANKQAALAGAGPLSDARQKELVDLEGLIQKKQIEADTTRAQAASAQLNARAKGEEAQAAEAVTSAARASAIAKKADADSAVALLQTQKQLAVQGEETARLMGDENLARHYRIEQMQIDVKITLAKADAMRVEAEGSINVARAKLEELRAKGQLTKVNEAELNASIKIAEAKIKEAAATKDLAGLLQNGVDAARNYGDAAGRAGDKSRGATDKAAEGWRDVATDARDAAKAAGEYQEKLGDGVQRVGGGFRNKDGWASDAKGNAITAREDPALRNQRLAAMFGEDMIGNQNAEAAYNLRNRISLLERYSDPTQGDGSLALLRKELERLMAAMERDRAAAQKQDRPAATREREAGEGRARSSGVASVVRVELPRGERYDVDTTTPAGRDQLNALIARVGADKRRAA